MGILVQTREVEVIDDLLSYADPHQPLAWLRLGDGIVAAGSQLAASLRVAKGDKDASRTKVLAQKWREFTADAEIDDPLGLPGTGLVAFGALVFDEDSNAESVLLVPSIIVGRHEGRCWVTRIGNTSDGASTTDYGEHWTGTLSAGTQNDTGYITAVHRALELIESGEVEKVVLARDLSGTVPDNADLRRLIRSLTNSYPDTWGFAVDGLIGASPETLVTAQAGVATSRVLAGTMARGNDPETDAAASAALTGSAKDRGEHEYAVHSVVASLLPHASRLTHDEHPFLLELPNVFHLATDVAAELNEGTTVLDLVADVHPTAAVAGTPRDAAMRTIRELEPFDRGRYAGPVGWVDSAGNGQWAIALRCAQFTPVEGVATRVTAYAGAGIVAGSDPAAELLETQVKFRPIVDAIT